MRPMGATSYERAEEPRPACEGIAKPGKPTPYDLLHDYISGPVFERAKTEARQICGTCPLQQDCLVQNRREAWAKAVLGINPRGGAPKGPVPPCGTDRKFWWHRRNGEAPCEPCKAANNAYKRELRAKKAAA